MPKDLEIAYEAITWLAKELQNYKDGLIPEDEIRIKIWKVRQELSDTEVDEI